MKKNIGFLGKVGLCLCLVFGLALSSCSTMKSGSGFGENFRSYRITVLVLPGTQPVVFPSEILNIDHNTPIINLWNKQERLELVVRIQKGQDLQMVFSQLASEGIVVKDITVEN